MSNLKEKKRIVNNVMALVLAGFQYHEACQEIDVSFGDFTYWIANTKSLQIIKDSYELQKNQLLEQALFRAGVGYEYKEQHATKITRKNKAGAILEETLIQKEIRKQALPNAAAALMILAKNNPDKWIPKMLNPDLAGNLETLRKEILATDKGNSIMEPPPRLPGPEDEIIDTPNKDEKKMIENDKTEKG